MEQAPKQITYGVYVRKSSEGEGKQVQSLVRQIGDLNRVIDRKRSAEHRVDDWCQVSLSTIVWLICYNVPMTLDADSLGSAWPSVPMA